MSWLFAMLALALGGLIVVYRPHVRSAVKELAIVVAAATGLGYLLFKPGPPKDIAALIEQSSACASTASKPSVRAKRSRKSKQHRSRSGC
ncbi:MAG: hypothetical protein ACR2PO_09160 [Methyloligellaceae bacterium]